MTFVFIICALLLLAGGAAIFLELRKISQQKLREEQEQSRVNQQLESVINSMLQMQEDLREHLARQRAEIGAQTGKLGEYGRKLDQANQILPQLMGELTAIVSGQGSLVESQNALADSHTQSTAALEPMRQAFTAEQVYAPWIKTKFKDALSLAPLLESTVEQGKSHLLVLVAKYLPDLGAGGIDGIEYSESQKTFVVAFSKPAQIVLDAREAVIDARGMLTLRDHAGRAFKAVARTEESARALGQAAAIGAAAAALARIIAGADYAKSFQKIGLGANFPAKSRQNDQIVRVERDYVLCQRLLSGPLDYFGLWELRRIADDLHDLRFRLRLEIRGRLQQIEDIETFDRICKTGHLAGLSEAQLEKEMLSLEEQLALLRFAFTFQVALEQSAGHLNTFMNCAVPVEAAWLEEVHNLFLTKKKNLFEINNHPEVIALGENFAQTLGFVRCLACVETMDMLSTVDYRGRLRISF